MDVPLLINYIKEFYHYFYKKYKKIKKINYFIIFT